MNKKEFDIIVVGELNVDLILNNLEFFPEKRKEKIAENMGLTLGSSSAIFASNLSTLGIKHIQNKSLCEGREFGNLMGAVNTTAHGGTGAFVTYL